MFTDDEAPRRERRGKGEGMKVVLYMDVYPGQKTFFANSEASAKLAGSRRYRFEVEIHDPLEVDANAVVLESSEVDK